MAQAIIAEVLENRTGNLVDAARCQFPGMVQRSSKLLSSILSELRERTIYATISCGPDIFPDSFYPVSEIVHTRVPVLQPQPHIVDLLHVQHLWLHPVDPRNLRNLVDAAFQQSQTQRLHNEYLNLVGLHFGLLRYRLESHRAIMWWPSEDSFCESRQGDFLPEECLVFVQQRSLADVDFEDVVSIEIPSVECEE